MTAAAKQIRLAPEQIAAFYHDVFVEDQVRDFRSMGAAADGELVVDIGGGCGFFAKRLGDEGGCRTRVLDMDQTSIDRCKSIGVDALIGDALDAHPKGDEDAVCFNLLLHHLVGRNDRDTSALQLKALEAWHGKAKRVFVNEYIYESFGPNISGRLIFQITSSRILSAIARQLARVIPAFRANTFGVGVRFVGFERDGLLRLQRFLRGGPG